MKKKLFSLIIALLCLCVMFTFVACDSDDETTTTTADNGNTPADPSDGTGDNTGSGGEDDPSIGGNTGSTVHRHTYATEWSTTETHHWHAATCEHTDEKKDYAEHAWGEGEVIRPATCTLEGVKRYTCVCGETKDEDIPLVDHTYSPDWSFDATGHWHDYTCGCAVGSNDSFEGHQLETEIIKEATAVTKGLEKHTCKTCGYSYTTDTPWYIPGSDIPKTVIKGDYYEAPVNDYGNIPGWCFYGGKIYATLDYEVVETYNDYVMGDTYLIIELEHGSLRYEIKKNNGSITFYERDDDGKIIDSVTWYKENVDIIYKDYTGLILNGYFEGERNGNTLGFFFKNNNVYAIRDSIVVGVGPYEIIKQEIFIDGAPLYFAAANDCIKIMGVKFYPADLSGGVFDDDYDPDDPEHEHVYADLWLYDDTHHWHNAICGHWDEVKDLGEHEWDEGVVIRAATCLKAGELTYTCSCGATYTEEIPMLTEQNWDEGTVTVSPTCSGPGTMLYTCECGATREETIPQLEHTYAIEWSYDKEYHWHIATCGHSDLKTEYYTHEWDDGVVTTPATCGAPGVKTYTCECGATKTNEIPRLDHTYATEWTWDETHHWKTATCEHTDLIKNYAEHTWVVKYMYDSSNACGSRVTYIYGCDCGASKSETESNEVHSFSDEWSLNETHHWREATCEHYNEKGDYSEHTWDDVHTEVIPSSCGERTITTYTCVCGVSKTEETSNEVHSFSDEWTQSETHHWHAAICEHSDLKDGYELHQYGSDRTCTVCSFFFDGSYTAGLEYRLDYSTQNTYIVDGIGTATDTDIIIPATYQGLPVTGIGVGAFIGCSHLTSIQFPDSITNIGDQAFSGCSGLIQVENGVSYVGKWAVEYDSYGSVTDVVLRADTVGIADGAFSYSGNLTSIEMPAGLKNIGYSAFRDCTSLTSINIPNDVTSISGEAFSGCTSLASINIPNSVIRIGDWAFEGCTSLIQVVNGVSYVDKWVVGCDETVTDVVLRADTIGIADGAFRRCETLTSIELPAGLKSIGSYAFENCSALTSVNITDNIVYLGEYGTFRGCASLTSIYIPNGITTIGESMFYGAGITSIIIPDNVKSIGGQAFYGCGNLESVTIGDGVTSIGYYAFRACPNLTSVIIGSGVESVGSVAFGECPKLESVIIKDGVKVIPDSMFSGCNALTSIEIPDSVTSIGAYAFSRCTSLTSLVIPKSVTSIGDYAFNFGGEAAKIYYLGTEEEWKAITLGTVGDETVIYFYSEEEPTKFGNYWHYVEGVASVWEWKEDPNAEYFNFTLLDDGTYSIKPKNKSDLPAELVLPSSYQGIAVTTIAEMAFYNCEALTSIVIPDSIVNIGSMAFYSCLNLADITIGKNVASIGNLPLYYCPALTSITVDAANTSYQSKSNCLIENATKTLIVGCNHSTIPTDGSVTVIGPAAFAMCTELTSITIPACVTSIGESAFTGCTGLISITVDAANTVYQSKGNCLIEIATKTLIMGCANSTIPTDGSVTVIGAQAFYGIESLTSITIPNTVTAIGDSAFAYCSSLEKISIPNSVTSVGASAFAYCAKLETITIGKDLTDIGMASFAGCTALTEIIIDEQNSVYAFSNACLINKQTKSLVHMLPSGKIPTDGSVTSIGDYAFANRTGLTDITIPDTITNIGAYAFYYCQELVSITIPKSVTSIGDYAFLLCFNLDVLYYEGTETKWKTIAMGTGNDYYLEDITFYYSETEPTDSGNYWHYVEGVPTAW